MEPGPGVAEPVDDPEPLGPEVSVAGVGSVDGEVPSAEAPSVVEPGPVELDSSAGVFG